MPFRFAGHNVVAGRRAFTEWGLPFGYLVLEYLVSPILVMAVPDSPMRVVLRNSGLERSQGNAISGGPWKPGKLPIEALPSVALYSLGMLRGPSDPANWYRRTRIREILRLVWTFI